MHVCICMCMYIFVSYICGNTHICSNLIYISLIYITLDICARLTPLPFQSTAEFILSCISIFVIPFSDSEKCGSCYLQFTYSFSSVMSCLLDPIGASPIKVILFLAMTACLVTISFLAPSLSCQKKEKGRKDQSFSLFFSSKKKEEAHHFKNI